MVEIRPSNLDADILDRSAAEFICNRLAEFRGTNKPSIRLDLSAVDSIDADAIAILVTGISAFAAAGGFIILFQPNQLLAHTLYKIGAFQRFSGLTLEGLEIAEPYAG